MEMTTEQFQILVLEKLGSLEDGQKKLEDGLVKVDERLVKVEEKLVKVDERLVEVENGLSTLTEKVDGLEKTANAIHEQTADLTEFKVETKTEFLDIKSTISRIEIATADNWSDIARLKSVR